MNNLYALALAGVTVASAAASAMVPAKSAQAVPDCPANTICLWSGQYGGGDIYKWTGGYRDLPQRFHDHVGSFRARRGGAFIDYESGSKICRPVAPGDYADRYLGRFGGQMDAIDDHC